MIRKVRRFRFQSFKVSEFPRIARFGGRFFVHAACERKAPIQLTNARLDRSFYFETLKLRDLETFSLRYPETEAQ